MIFCYGGWWGPLLKIITHYSTLYVNPHIYMGFTFNYVTKVRFDHILFLTETTKTKTQHCVMYNGAYVVRWFAMVVGEDHYRDWSPTFPHCMSTRTFTWDMSSTKDRRYVSSMVIFLVLEEIQIKNDIFFLSLGCLNSNLHVLVYYDRRVMFLRPSQKYELG